MSVSTIAESDAVQPGNAALEQPDWAIRVRGLGKAYRTYGSPLDLLKEVATGKPRHEENWVLRDVSFEVPRGSIVGIIGPNGAGKSTLLKIVAGLLDASAGTAEVRGRVSAILELGTGFHPDFTGRQNIITGGMCLGMSRAEIEERQQWIIDFSELASVIDRPFKTYSSGMQARLTFSTAVSIDPEVFIVDEALAAGDAYFVSKCFRRIREICSSGATVLFVSHGTNQVAQMCQSAIWLQDGLVRSIGPARDVAKQYDYETHVRISNNAGQIVELPLESANDSDAGVAAGVPGVAASPTHEPAVTAAAPSTPTADMAALEEPAPSAIDVAVSDEKPEPTPPAAALATAKLEAVPDADTTVRSAMQVYRKGPVLIDKVILHGGDGQSRSVFRTWDELRIDVHYTCEGDIPAETLGLAFGIERESDLVLIAQCGTVLPAGNETQDYDAAPFRRRASKAGLISAIMPSLQMMNGDYLLSVGILPNVPGAVDFYEYRHRTYNLRVIAAGYPSGAAFYPLVEWRHTSA